VKAAEFGRRWVQWDLFPLVDWTDFLVVASLAFLLSSGGTNQIDMSLLEGIALSSFHSPLKEGGPLEFQ
jgi:hypothetical protein